MRLEINSVTLMPVLLLGLVLTGYAEDGNAGGTSAVKGGAPRSALGQASDQSTGQTVTLGYAESEVLSGGAYSAPQELGSHLMGFADPTRVGVTTDRGIFRDGAAGSMVSFARVAGGTPAPALTHAGFASGAYWTAFHGESSGTVLADGVATSIAMFGGLSHGGALPDPFIVLGDYAPQLQVRLGPQLHLLLSAGGGGKLLMKFVAAY